MLVPLITSSNSITPKDFWTAVLIYYEKPHVVNRRLLAASQGFSGFIKSKKIKNFKQYFTKHALLYEANKLNKLTKEELTKDLIENLLKCYDKDLEIVESNLEDFKLSSDSLFVSLRFLISRSNCSNTLELVLLDKRNETNSARFISVSKLEEKQSVAPPFPYEIELDHSNLRITVDNFEDADTTQAEWLVDKLFYKLIGWIETDSEPKLSSLCQVEADTYSLNYHRLKVRYGEGLVKRWKTKAKTDPQKYIFEDLAIAAYLITLWEKYKQNNVKFVDLGCGNGLLVHVLNKEGFEGFGLDLRKRQSWELFPESKLVESPVYPSSTFDCNWIIGNHSDELTPWIPIIARKCNSSFFVLPCCPFDLKGNKFIRKNTKLSQYGDFLTYVQNLSKSCGYDPLIDKLRIPSTKRICLIGLNQNNDTLERADELINEFKDNFKLPVAIKPTKNCTQLDKDLIRLLIGKIVLKLLQEQNPIKNEEGKLWNRGSTLTIKELIECFTEEEKKQLKSEGNGLTTLMKNHSYIFQVSKNSVQLKLPVKLKDTDKYKLKDCWFLLNHPDGCLNTSETCGFSHNNKK